MTVGEMLKLIQDLRADTEIVILDDVADRKIDTYFVSKQGKKEVVLELEPE